MPRAKTAALRPRGHRPSQKQQDAVLLQVAPQDDITPLVTFFASLPSENSGASSRSDDHEPPSKRTKLHQAEQYTTIKQLTLAVHGRCTAKIDPCARKDIGRHLKIKLGPGVSGRSDPKAGELVLMSDWSSEAGHLEPIKPWLMTALTPELRAALRLAEELRTNPGETGAIWVGVDAEILLTGRDARIELSLNINWNDGEQSIYTPLPKRLRAPKESFLLDFFGADSIASASETAWSPQDFYEAAHVPDKADLDPKQVDMRVANLKATLYPFQKRAVHWLLERERVSLRDGFDTQTEVTHTDIVNLEDRYDYAGAGLPLSFQTEQDVDGQEFFVSPLYGVITKDLEPHRHIHSHLRGGILAEEMGLGKTLEMSALIALHRRPETELGQPILGGLRPTKATLIITPASLLQQWLSELDRHAPSLSVIHYGGLRTLPKLEQTVEDVVDDFTNFDIVITTYDVLRADFHSAVAPPERKMRTERRYDRPKSPLVQMQWWRVCIDEAQMVENYESNTSTLARIIPRVNAWAITGTPVKDDVRRDLKGLLVFLWYELLTSQDVWNRFTSFFKAEFRTLISTISLRHTKSLVRHEITLPPQKRYVITMPFTAVEEQHYQEVFDLLVTGCGLDKAGNPLHPTWDPDDGATVEELRQALDRLRQIVLHPQVGVRNRRALGPKNGPMRTVAQVLEAMLEQSETGLRTEQRLVLNVRLTKGQLLEETPRVKEALAIWQDVRLACEKIVVELRDGLKAAEERAKANEKTQAAHEQYNVKKETLAEDALEDDVSGEVGEARRKLRAALEVLHRAIFFCANGYHQIKSNVEMTKPKSDEFQELEALEVKTYEEAKIIRREILQEGFQRATSFKQWLADAASTQSFTTITELPEVKGNGIESRSILEGLDELYMFLNDQANQLDEWREQVVQLLLKPLVDEDDEAEITGEEYEESTQLQSDIFVYVQVLRALVRDRQDAFSGQKNMLVDHERRTAIAAAKEGEGPSPEKLLKLFAVRELLNQGNPAEPPKNRSLRTVLSELRTLAGKLRHDVAAGSRRAAAELEIVTKYTKETAAHMSEQTKLALALEQEVERYADAMNARIEFYRQFQEISDSVEKYAGPKDDAANAKYEKEEKDALERLNKAESKHRYLLHLKNADAEADDHRICVICRDTFTIGVLTVCGHQFCKDCITEWFKAHHNCPVCKRHLTHSNLHDITLKPQELRVHSESSQQPTPVGEHSSQSKRQKSTIYTDFDAQKLADIKEIELAGPSFTTKVDTLVRHLLWLRENDPGAKSIVFSQYQDFMNVLKLAFARHRIGFTSFNSPDGIKKFKDDVGIEVFLLHARAHSSGLNLVNASHVFLCEPLLNTALELQAIARVDRIGQAHETTVWLYVVDGTVEESIYNLSVQRRMQHIGRPNPNDKGKGNPKEATPELMDASLEAANTLEMQQASLSRLMGKGSSGETVEKGDLWQCLFGHVQKDAGRAAAEERAIDEMRENPAVRRFLAAEAAEGRASGAGLDDSEGTE